MNNLTRKYFDEQVGKLATKKDLAPLATRHDVRDAVDELAGIFKKGFHGVDQQLAAIVKMLDVRKDVEQLKLEMQEIRRALNIER